MVESTTPNEISRLKEYSLRITDPSVLEFLAAYPEERHVEMLLIAIQIGVVALQVTEPIQRTDFVETKFNQMVKEMGVITSSTETALRNRIIELFGDAETKSEGRIAVALANLIGKDSELIKLIGSDSDPSSISSRLKKLLIDALEGEGSTLIKSLAIDRDGSPLRKLDENLKEQVKDLKKEWTQFSTSVATTLSDEFGKIRTGLRIKEERAIGTAKGRDFQHWLEEKLGIMARFYKDKVEFVGDDAEVMGSKKGDLLITLNTETLGGVTGRIVVEAKSGNETFKKVREELTAAISRHGANRGIAVLTLPNEKLDINPYREEDNRTFVTVDSENDYALPLELAYRIARFDILRQKLSEKTLKVDVGAVIGKLDSAKALLAQFTQMKATATRVSEAGLQMNQQMDTLQKQLNDALDDISRLLVSPVQQT